MHAFVRQSIENSAKKNALVFVLSGNYANQKRFSWFRMQSGDRRTIYGRAYNSAVKAYAEKYERESEAAFAKHCERSRNFVAMQQTRQLFCDVTSNPLWLDYQNVKCYNSTKVFADHLKDGCRNHWAKTPQDFRVLTAILRCKKK